MDKDTIDDAALVMLIENHWQEFVELSGGEESAEMTVRALQNAAGMNSTAKRPHRGRRRSVAAPA